MAQYFTVHPEDPQPRLVRQAAAILRRGGLIAYPTDSSYALGCQIGDLAAARRLRQIRGVGEQHHLTLVCRDLAEIGRYAQIDTWQFRILKHGTPGSYTFILPATREVPRKLQHPKRNTVGVRVPDHAVVRALLTEFAEPILSSTLMLPGDEQPLNEPEAIRDAIGSQIDLIIDAGACHLEPTTVIDLAAQPPAVVRIGRGDPRRLGFDGVGGSG